MDIQLIRTFVTVAQVGSITAAARELRYSQPAVTAHVRALERHVSGSLFTRGAQGVRLTPLGARVLPHALALVSELDRIMAEHDAATRGRPVRVGYGPIPVQARYDVLAALVARHLPRVRLMPYLIEEPSTIEQWLLLGRTDLHLVPGPVTDPRLSVVPLTPLRVGARVSRGHRLAGQDAVALADLLALPTYPLRGTPWAWDQFWFAFPQRGGEPAYRRTTRATPTDCMTPIDDTSTVVICPSFMREVAPPADVWVPCPDYPLASLEVAHRSREDHPDVLAVARLWAAAAPWLTAGSRPPARPAGGTARRTGRPVPAPTQAAPAG